MSHVTGGGLANNLARVVPDTVRGADRPDAPGHRRRSSGWFSEVGQVSQPDLEATLNLGVGMVALVPPDAVDDALRLLADADCRPGSVARPTAPSPASASGSAWTVGTPRTNTVRLGGSSAAVAEWLLQHCSHWVAFASRLLTILQPRPSRRQTQVRGGRPDMGRGRAKAKQTKVARELKYRSFDTDFSSLERELRGPDTGTTSPAYADEVPPGYEDLAEYDDDDDGEGGYGDLRKSG